MNDVTESNDEFAIIKITGRDRNLHGGYIGRLAFDVRVTIDGAHVTSRTGLTYSQAVAQAESYQRCDWSAYSRVDR